jgi:hypothetical protein
MPLPGVGGSLFPGGFLARLAAGSNATDLQDPSDEDLERTRRRFVSWWQNVEKECGPATGIRALFDLVAMPLAALLGFRARNAEFEPASVRAELRADGRQMDLVLIPWAARPSALWRDLFRPETTNAPSWCLLLAPPFVSLVDLRGHALRHAADFELPAALDARTFAAFWAVCRGGDVLDALVKRAARFQDTVRQDLQVGVVQALETIAPALRTQRGSSAITSFSESLTIVYRVLFLLFAESRDLVPRHHPAFGPGYTISSLCREALSSPLAARGLWDGLAAVTRLLRRGCDTTDLIVRPFNGRLFARASAPALERSRSNRRSRRGISARDKALAQSLIALATRPGGAGREEISYADLGVEQLGAVYERVLDLDADTIGDAQPSDRAKPHSAGNRAHSNRRKDSGTFYTPQVLAEFVVRRTLSPLVRDASTDDILALRIVDPAMGSGAFLVAACRFLSDSYERALVNEGRCAETDLNVEMRSEIRRTVAGRCLAGVDANPVAVQLARLSLWLTTLAKDKPLSFLDHQLRVGDSLVGATPDDLWRDPTRGRPTTATAQAGLFDTAELDAAMRDTVRPLRTLRDGRDDSVADVRERERLWTSINSERSPLTAWRQACDLWCARWYWNTRGPSPAEVRAVIASLTHSDRTLKEGVTRVWLQRAREIATRHGFFHWPLEFADVFYDNAGSPRSQPGFDAVIGNPPWDLVGRDRATLVTFVRESGCFPSCGRGRLNLYQPFVERALTLTRPGGRVGLVLPWSFCTDDGASALRRELFDRTRVDTIVGLENSGGLFPIHRGLRFGVLGATVGGRTSEIRPRFGLRSTNEIETLPDFEDASNTSTPSIRLTLDTLRRVGGPLLRIPDVRRAQDLERFRKLCRVLPALGDPQGWAVRFGRELNATEDSSLFGDDGLPVIDGKHIEAFRVHLHKTDRRIPATLALGALPDRRYEHARLAYRDVSGVGNKHALIAAVVPPKVVTTHTLFCLRTPLPLECQHFLCALFNSRELDTIVRMLMGSHVTTSLVEHLPVPKWTGDTEQREISRLAESLADSPEAPEIKRELDGMVSTLFDRALK